jgi:hypothetical protein
MQGVSLVAARRGFLEAGVKDNEILIFSELMDAKSLFLTANADTVYFLGFIDVSKGPMVFEVPPKVLGALDDMWFRWVIDFGLPGPDRGTGGKYLILPPGYDGPVPEAGYSVARSRTTRLLIMGRAFLENKNDPKPAVESIKKFTKLYPYDAGGVGTPIAEFLSGKAKLGKISNPPATVFHEGSGKVMNTVPPSDWSFYEMLNEIVQQEPATSLDPSRWDRSRHRHHQGQALCARRADEEDPDRSACGRQCYLAQPVHESARSVVVLLSQLGWWNSCLSPATSSRRPSQ